jgi:hypothetical protein
MRAGAGRVAELRKAGTTVYADFRRRRAKKGLRPLLEEKTSAMSVFV